MIKAKARKPISLLLPLSFLLFPADGFLALAFGLVYSK
jgi:hypothetical protein